MLATCNLIRPNRMSWLCLAAFIYTSVTLWSIQGDLTPPLANTLFPNPNAPQQWHFDYEAAELILAKVTFTDKGELLLNPELAKILSKAIDSLPKQLNDEALQRINFLLAMSFPKRTRAAEELGRLLINYYHLQYAVTQASSTDHKSSNTRDKLAAFLETVARENHYLGEDNATLLFGEQRSITRYLLERKIIKENATLNQQQKIQQLNRLKKPLKRRP